MLDRFTPCCEKAASPRAQLGTIKPETILPLFVMMYLVGPWVSCKKLGQVLLTQEQTSCSAMERHSCLLFFCSCFNISYWNVNLYIVS